MGNIGNGFAAGAIVGYVLSGIIAWLYLVFATYGPAITWLSLQHLEGLLATVIFIVFAFIVLPIPAAIIGLIGAMVVGIFGAIIGALGR